MPADIVSAVLLILLRSAETVERLGPYLAGGIAAAWLSSKLVTKWPARLSCPSFPGATPLAALMGTLSPFPTTGIIPFVLRLQDRGLAGDTALAFILASSLMNPQLFVLTLGAFGLTFSLVQLGAVLSLSVFLGKLFGSSVGIRGGEVPRQCCEPFSVIRLIQHVGLYFLLGVMAGSALQVLLPWTGALNWLAKQGLLRIPVLGWIGAPFYVCGGSSVPLARSLLDLGFSQGALFTFLLVGPSLRVTALANLACFLSGRAMTACLAILVTMGGLLGWGFDFAIEALK